MGQYGPEDKHKVYEQMKSLAGKAIKQGKDVVLDATFYKRSIRDIFSTLAEEHREPLALIWVEAGEALVRERLSSQREDSEADFEVYLKLKKEFEPPREPHLKLISGPNSISAMLQEAEKYIQDL